MGVLSLILAVDTIANRGYLVNGYPVEDALAACRRFAGIGCAQLCFVVPIATGRPLASY